MNSKKILILGAGTGGLVAANELRRQLPGNHKIAIIERNQSHSLAPSFLWVMTGERKINQITCPTSKLLRGGIELVIDQIQEIDLSQKAVKTAKTKITYDYLIIAAGAELAFELLPGADLEFQTFYTAEGSARLHEKLREFRGGKIAIVVMSTPYKCPGAPHEGAMLIADYFRRKRPEIKADIQLFTPEPQPMPVAGFELGAMIKNMLESKGIVYQPQHKVSGISEKKLKFEDGHEFGYDLLVIIPPHRSPQFVRESDLANESGWIPIDKNILSTKFENVFAIGDVTTISIPGRWKPDVPLMLPKAGVFAHSQALTVSKRLTNEILGRKSNAQFCGDGFCMLEAGEDLAGFAYGNFFAEPSPDVRLKKMGRSWHLGKVLFEKWWLSPYGMRRSLLRSAIIYGGKTLGVPLEL